MLCRRSSLHCDGVTPICVGERERQDTYTKHNLDLRSRIGGFMNMKLIVMDIHILFTNPSSDNDGFEDSCSYWA